MCKLFFSLVLLTFGSRINAQTSINGTISDKKGNPIAGANWYLEGTYDGSTSLENGEFNFEITETGMQKLVVSFISFETKKFIIRFVIKNFV